MVVATPYLWLCRYQVGSVHHFQSKPDSFIANIVLQGRKWRRGTTTRARNTTLSNQLLFLIWWSFQQHQVSSLPQQIWLRNRPYLAPLDDGWIWCLGTIRKASENNFREWAEEGLFLLLFLHLLMSDHQETMSSGFVLRLRCSIGRRGRSGSKQSSCVISGTLGNWVTFGLNFPSQVQVKVCLICTEEVSDVLENETGCTGQGQLSWVCKSHPQRRRANSCQPHQRRSL